VHIGHHEGVDAAVERATPRSRRLALIGVAVVVFLYVLSSLGWPHVVPRLTLLPKPAPSTWYDGCNWHGRSYERSGVVWVASEDMTTRACPEGGLPEEDA
jgi:hypothetical protein